MADVQFSAGSPDFAKREDLAPWSEDPRSMFRTAAGLGGGYGMGQAGLGMLGGAARAYNALPTVERMFAPAAGMLGGLGAALGVGPAAAAEGMPAQESNKLTAELQMLEAKREREGRLDPADHLRRIEILQKLGKPVTYEKRAEAPGMIRDVMAARPSGAGDRRDKRLRDAEDRDTRTG